MSKPKFNINLGETWKINRENQFHGFGSRHGRGGGGVGWREEVELGKEEETNFLIFLNQSFGGNFVLFLSNPSFFLRFTPAEFQKKKKFWSCWKVLLSWFVAFLFSKVLREEEGGSRYRKWSLLLYYCPSFLGRGKIRINTVIYMLSLPLCAFFFVFWFRLLI